MKCMNKLCKLCKILMTGLNTTSGCVYFCEHNTRNSTWGVGSYLSRCCRHLPYPWWRHPMETFPALLVICAGNSPVTGEFPSQRPVTRNFGVSLICTWINDRVNNREAGDLRRHRAHYDVTVVGGCAFRCKCIYIQRRCRLDKSYIQINTSESISTSAVSGLKIANINVHKDTSYKWNLALPGITSVEPTFYFK